MRKHIWNLSLFLFAGLMIMLSIWGPEALTDIQDKAILNVIHEETAKDAGEGYRYTLSSSEKLSILSRSLNSRNDVDAGTAESYAFIVNNQGPSEKEISSEEIYNVCNLEVNRWKELGLIPDTVREVEKEAYEAVLYSAIDVLEPRNNVAVWKISLSMTQKNADKKNRIMDVYLDADNGKIYELYARTELSWQEIEPDRMVDIWSDYLELLDYTPYNTDNPLLEITPNFKKYNFAAASGEDTVVTVGFYEGINELFLKISK